MEKKEKEVKGAHFSHKILLHFKSFIKLSLSLQLKPKGCSFDFQLLLCFRFSVIKFNLIKKENIKYISFYYYKLKKKKK